MSEKLDRIEEILERLWGHLALRKEVLEEEYNRGYADGRTRGRELGYEAGMKAGYEEGKLFNTTPPDDIKVFRREIKK